jgi:hypothetical protein
MKNVYKILVEKPEGKRPLARPRRRSRIILEWRDVDGMHLAQDRDQWPALVNKVMNHGLLFDFMCHFLM